MSLYRSIGRMSRRPLTFRMLCLAATAATLPAMVIAVVLRTISSHALEASIQSNQMEIAQRVADKVNGEIRYAQGLLQYVARMPAVAAGSLAETRQALKNLMRSLPSVQEAMQVSDSGEERVKISRQGPIAPLIKRNINLKERSIGPPFFSGNRLPTVLITEPVPPVPGRRLSHAIVLKMSFSSLGSLMQQTRVGQRGMAYVVDQGGALLAHIDEERVRSHESFARMPVVQDWLTHPSKPTSLHEYVDENGVPVIALAYPMPLLQSAVIVQQPKADVYAPLKRMRSQLIGWTVLWVCLFLAVTVVLAWRIQQPLRQLQSAADQIAGGNMDVKLDIHTHDELEELGKAFSHMTDSLRQMEGMRRDLINMIVHDLKSPLTSILASMDYLLTGQVGTLNKDQAKFLQLGHRSGAELLTLIQNLLDVAKMEEGKLELRLETFAPLEWAEEVTDSFRPVVEAGKKRLQLHVTAPLPMIQADRVLLGRVLGNLLSNSLRHTQLEKGEVVVSLSHQNDQVAVEVRDNGQGIPPEYQTRIFEKFVQVERKRAHLRTGTGLGLTFCKMVIEAHGGRIFVQSIPTQGSAFTFVLPLRVQADVPPVDAGRSTPAILSGSQS